MTGRLVSGDWASRRWPTTRRPGLINTVRYATHGPADLTNCLRAHSAAHIDADQDRYEQAKYVVPAIARKLTPIRRRDTRGLSPDGGVADAALPIAALSFGSDHWPVISHERGHRTRATAVS